MKPTTKIAVVNPSPGKRMEKLALAIPYGYCRYRKQNGRWSKPVKLSTLALGNTQHLP